MARSGITLLEWCENNGEFGDQLKQEFMGKLETGETVAIDEVSYGSHKKALWRCLTCNAEWYAEIKSRTSAHYGCHCCSGKIVSDKNSLENWCNNNGDFGDRLKKEWTGQLESGETISIDEVSYGSHKKALWRCLTCNTEWYSTIRNRTSARSGCPCCSGKIVSDKNSLENWCNNNGDFGDRLRKEWTGQLESGETIPMDEISFGNTKRVLWRCVECNNEWYATTNRRTSQFSGCNSCNKHGTSYPEQFLYRALKQIYPSAENRCRVLKSESNPYGFEFDIGIAEIPLCIEYSPTGWHRYQERQDKDNIKKELCKRKNIRLITIIEDTYSKLQEHYFSPDEIVFHMEPSKKDEQLIEILTYILSTINHSIDEINLDKVKEEAWRFSHKEIDYEKSLEYLYPELVKEWNQTLNKDIKPNQLLPNTHKKIFWECPQCNFGKNGEWCSSISNRTSQKQGCPSCGFNFHTQQVNEKAISKVTVGKNDLQTIYPELAKEWHPTLNEELTTDSVLPGSHKKIYWQCQNCGHGRNGEWCVRINDRVSRKTGCTKCGYNWHKKCVVSKKRKTNNIGNMRWL